MTEQLFINMFDTMNKMAKDSDSPYRFTHRLFTRPKAEVVEKKHPILVGKTIEDVEVTWEGILEVYAKTTDESFAKIYECAHDIERELDKNNRKKWVIPLLKAFTFESLIAHNMVLYNQFNQRLEDAAKQSLEANTE